MRGGIMVILRDDLLVLPFSALPKRPFVIDIVMVIVDQVAVGLPIARSMRRWAPKI